ncbi:MAG: MATE family efflux transporter [Clostridia bacterium]|nr:MATE family efflux transporter [Clostridia bacterium]
MDKNPQSQRSVMLGTLPMRTLVPKVSVPIMVSMIVQALYNVVDSIYVSRFDPDALTAVSLAYPFQMLMIALGVGMGTGIASLLSRKLGEGAREEARQASWNGMLIEGGGSLLFVLLGLFLAPTLMGLVVTDNLQNAAGILDMGVTYLRTVTTFSTGLFMSVLMERMLQSTGNTVFSMLTQLSGALTNIILDPILIFGYLGAPRLGVLGAAVATVIGQWVSAGVGFTFNQVKNAELRLNPRDCKISGWLLRAIFAVGLPSTVMQAIGSVMNIGMNRILSTFPEAVGNAAVNVLNVYFKLQSFIFMPVFGLGTGMIAIVGYNYGARLKQRVYEAIRVAMIYAVSILAAGTLIFQLFPEQLMAIFESESGGEVAAQMVVLGATALRIISLNFVIASVGITFSNVFQAVGRGTYSMLVSILRQLAVLLPAAWLLKEIFGTVDAVWWCFVLAEFFSMVICLLLYRKLRREVLEKL